MKRVELYKDCDMMSNLTIMWIWSRVRSTRSGELELELQAPHTPETRVRLPLAGERG